MLIGRVLGPTEIERDGRPVDLGGPLPRRLVTALLEAEGRPVSETALTAAVWGDEPPASPSVSLRAYVSRLRRGIGRDALARAGDGYRLMVDETDAARFAAEVRRGRELLDDERPGEALRAFEAGLGRWRGEAFADLLDEYAGTSLAELRAVATEERLAARLASGDAPGVVPELEAAAEAEPYRERRWELLILALYRSGRQAEALATLRRVRDRLGDELGVDPGPALQVLERQLLAQDPRLLLPARPAVAVRPLSRFFGRSNELAALAELSEANRMVTLVGPAGAGKTRLAIEYAAARDPWFVRLADVADSGQVTAAVATAMGVRGGTVESIVTALGSITGLLVLDNCEHVVAAAADLSLALLARCPGLRVLATSREPLGVDAERLLPVAPLPASDAVALLTDRITAVRPGWQPSDGEPALLDRLAAALDGIPLALELAAARARMLGLGELLDTLEGRFPAVGPVPRGALTPHQTLEAAIAWSVDLLSASDRALLLRLWPFEGGFPLAALENDLDGLSSLVARSMVVADTTVTPTRYRLLEMVRAYCRRNDPDPAASRAAHAAWVRGLVEQHTPQLGREHSPHASRTLNRELLNLHAAIRHDLEHAPVDALRTAGRLEWFWHRGGHVGIGLPLLRAALTAAPDAPRPDRARALLGIAALHSLTGDRAAAWAASHAAVGLLAEPSSHEERLIRAQASYYAARLWMSEGAFDEAVTSARASMTRAREIGEDWFLPAASTALGAALAATGRVAQGRTVLAQAAEDAIGLRQGWTAAMSELMLARTLLIDDPEPQWALTVLQQALAGFVEEDDLTSTFAVLQAGALALARAGHLREGATLMAGVHRLARRRGLDTVDPAITAALENALAGFDRTEASRAATGLDQEDLYALLSR